MPRPAEPDLDPRARQARLVAERSRDPLAGPDDGGSGDGFGPGDEARTLAGFLALAVLRYGRDDGPDRWRRAAGLLRQRPGLPALSVHAAAAAGDADALRVHLARDPALASAEGGPFRLPPLLYLSFSRLGVVGDGGDAASALDVLLEAGADPAAGFCWQGLTPPFTALTGVLGGGEADQPPHPAAAVLADRLLAAGADANDGQALYNRMFGSSDDHLELLLRHGLGRGDGGRWHRDLPDLTDDPAALLASQLGWAVVHGLAARIRLLAAHGTALDRPLGGLPGLQGQTPVRLARRSGRPEVVDLLLELGAPDEADAEGRLLVSLLTGDAGEVERLTAADPAALRRLRRAAPSLVLRAAVADRLDGVRLLAAQGFDVNAFGRHDLPAEQPWETALHHAAGEGKDDLVRLLLVLGADPAVRDTRFGATPLGWARHLGRPGTAALLEPVSPDA